MVYLCGCSLFFISFMDTIQSQKVQVLRGIAIIGVVLIHTTWGGYWQVVFRPFVNYSVALFLFISGFLTKVTNDNWSSFYSKRVLRVLLPFLLWTLIYTLPSTNLKDYLEHILFANATPHLYYLFVYIQFVLLTPLLGRLALSKHRWIGFLIAPVSIIGYTYVNLVFGVQPNWLISNLWAISALGWFGFYYLGLLLGNGLMTINIKWQTLILLYGLTILLQIGEGYVWYIFYGMGTCGTQLKLTSLLTSSIALFAAYKYILDSKMSQTPIVLKKIGDFSFGIYLSHELLLMLLSNHTTWYSEIHFVLNAVIILTLSFVLVATVRRLVGERVSRWIGFA